MFIYICIFVAQWTQNKHDIQDHLDSNFLNIQDGGLVV